VTFEKALDLMDKALNGDKGAIRDLAIAVGHGEIQAASEHRRGWQDCLDFLGAGMSGEAPMLRAAALKDRIIV